MAVIMHVIEMSLTQAMAKGIACWPYAVVPELVVWLQQNVGQQWVPSDDPADNSLHNWNYHFTTGSKLDFYFSHERDAMLFKLTWL